MLERLAPKEEAPEGAISFRSWKNHNQAVKTGYKVPSGGGFLRAFWTLSNTYQITHIRVILWGNKCKIPLPARNHKRVGLTEGDKGLNY